MRRNLFQASVVLLALMVLSAPALAQEVGEEESRRVTDPNFFGMTLFGRSIIYSLNYDRCLNDHFGLGGGIGTFVTGDDGWFMFPVYMNFYPVGGPKFAPMVSAGVTWIAGEVWDDDMSGPVGVIGVGFEYRSDFTFRLSVNLISSEQVTFAPYPGFVMGGSF